MPVYHFTLHAYRSWNADHPDGYHQHGEKGVHPPNAAVARHRNLHAKFTPVEFTEPLQQVLIDMVQDICRRRKWRPHGMVANPSHIHLAISWPSAPPDAKAVQTVFKRLLGWCLAKHTGLFGRKWLSEGAKPERVKDRQHLRHLLDEYFPSHKGTYWREDAPL
jgi:REP element-mobilizing transposase RayT